MPSHGHSHWAPAAPFRLPNGAVAEGRPDLIALLTAREPHEALQKEGAGEKADLSREKALAKEKERLAQSYSGKPNKSDLADFIGAEVPSAMLGSTFAKLKESVAEVRIAKPNEEPLLKPRRPSHVGIYRTKDTAVEVKLNATRHNQAQHSPTRTGFDATTGFTSGNGGGGGSGTHHHDGGGNDTGAGTHSSSSARGSAGVGASSNNGAGGGGGGGNMTHSHQHTRAGGTMSSPDANNGNHTNAATGGALPRYVRVGVPVATVPGAPTMLMVEDERSGMGSRMLGGGGGGSRSGVMMSRMNTVGGGVGGGGHPGLIGTNNNNNNNNNHEAALMNASMVSFRHATADLPHAATIAVRQMLEQHRPLTVATIHQRRPPYLDLGPPQSSPDSAPSLHPDNYASLLRKSTPSSDSLGPKRRPFVSGCPPPWARGKTAAFQTFEFMAKQSGLKYYISDFTQPTKPPMRPPTSGTTRADRAPSMMYKTNEVYEMRHNMPPQDYDSTLRYTHPDSTMHERRPTTAPGAHLLPYLNAPERRMFFP